MIRIFSTRRSLRAAHLAAAAAVALSVLLLGAAPAAAHELGIVRVIATFLHDGTYRTDLIVDTEHLPPVAGPERRLEPPPAGIEALDTLGAAERRRIETFLAAYLESTEMTFDGRAGRSPGGDRRRRPARTSPPG